MLLGIVAIAAGLRTAIGHPGATLTAGPAVALAGGVTLFLIGDVLFRWVLLYFPGQPASADLPSGIPWYRAAAAAAALAAWPVATAVDAAAGIALLTAIVAAALVIEQATVKA